MEKKEKLIIFGVKFFVIVKWIYVYFLLIILENNLIL